MLRIFIGAVCLSLCCLSAPARQNHPARARQTPGAEAGNRPTALMRAAESGEVAKVRAILKGGADVNARLGSGATALTLAARRGHVEVVKLLLRRGADPNAKLHSFHAGDFTALMAAIDRDVGRRTEILDAMIASGAEVNPTGAFGRSPLMYAIERRDVLSLKHLLSKGADVNLKSAVGVTPLMVAVLSRSEPGILRLLIEAGADVNARSDDGTTALMLAEAQEDAAAARLLREAGARR
ncbi:MAG TPA: ankyrin repeat domain-containing protein [Pyrinomonadaceae bacterium]|nr:ankyrin repeat domain-containing protein [Pyrinomonadaceae bacterium]